MRKKYVRWVLHVVSAALVMAALTGCAEEAPTPAEGGLVRDQNPEDRTAQGQTAGENGTGNGADSGKGGTEPSDPAQRAGESEPEVYYTDDLHTKEENILPITGTASARGISYQIGKVEYTKNFGDRNRKNLGIFSPEVNTDSEGNLSEGFQYLFLTITFTNTTDQTQEIVRTDNDISVIGASLVTIPCAGEACYYDSDWQKGTESERHHWVLEPGESVISEIGWIIESSSRMTEEDPTLESRMGSAGPYQLYYHVKENDGDNENSYFFDLGVKAE